MFLKAQMPHLNPGICQLIATPQEINAADLTFISAFSLVHLQYSAGTATSFGYDVLSIVFPVTNIKLIFSSRK